MAYNNYEFPLLVFRTHSPKYMCAGNVPFNHHNRKLILLINYKLKEKECEQENDRFRGIAMKKKWIQTLNVL